MFNCYFCFYFTFTICTNGPNTAIFILSKRIEKINLKANPLVIKTFSFPSPYYSDPPDYFWHFFQPSLLFYTPVYPQRPESRHDSFARLKQKWTFQGKWSFTHQEGLQVYLNKGLQNECFTGKFPNIFTKTFFFKSY